jgi:zinc protease
MKKNIIILGLLLATCAFPAQEKITQTTQQTDANGLVYQVVKNDPSNTRIYTLKNGLKVYLSRNTREARIQTYIAVRAGSVNDPADNTGLAHYLEHMLSKGTPNLGTTNWTEEKPLIDEIAKLYEAHKTENDPEKKKAIYAQIDAAAQKASTYAIAREGHKLMKGMGATGTNAHTGLNETIYKNNIPSNELERWMKLETERFSPELVFRLFSTEIEAVYEEYNRAQDNDDSQIYYQSMAATFPGSTYGTMTLGKPEHLKNPSVKAMAAYHRKYYVPNNMAVCLAGDLEYDSTIKMLETYFGTWQPGKVEADQPVFEKPLKGIQRVPLKSPSPEKLQLTFRTDKMGSANALKVHMISELLSNDGSVGLMDLNLIQPQALLSASSEAWPNLDYGIHFLSAKPKDGQTLAEVETLLLSQIELIKQGKFEPWMLTAIVNNEKKNRLKAFESNESIATKHFKSFINRLSWEDYLGDIQQMEKLTKADIVKFANEFYQNNYVAVYQNKGQKDNLVRVDKPQLTPIKINRESQSDFAKNLDQHQSKSLSPVFLDYQKDIKTQQLNASLFHHVANPGSDLASLYLVYPVGGDHSKKINLALGLADELDSKAYSSIQFKQQMFKLGVDYSVNVADDQTYIYFTGLGENLPKALELWEQFTQNLKPKQSVLDTRVAQILTNRKNAKTNKASIANALANYAKYGQNSRFRNIIPEAELKAMKVETLCQEMAQLKQLKHEIFYFGNQAQAMQKTLQQYHNTKASQAAPVAKIFEEAPTQNKVYFCNYDMVQVDIQRVGQAPIFTPENLGYNTMYNNYFGGSFSSIVFQEIREAKGLAYSAVSQFFNPSEQGKHAYVTFAMGTQANKLGQAAETIQNLFANPPQAPKQLEIQKQSLISSLNAERISPENIYFMKRNAQKLGFTNDVRQNVYRNLQDINMAKFNAFFDTQVKPLNYSTCILGKKENVDFKALEKFGPLQTLSLEELFNY